VEKLGKYEILAELGHGAMGVVYQARDPFIGRLVALKTINSNLVDRPDLLERFYQEAQSAGKLQHPNIVTIFELGQEKDTPFIAMEYLDGESLEKTIVRQADLPLALKVGYVVRICQALEYAHKNRVVHRDIKPGNIMVNSEGVVKVVDFGIARLVDFSRTHTNMMIGTPAYMAPELFRKKKADERTDIWAVGITFYELLCYQRPFTGDGYDIIRAIMEDEYPPVASVLPDCGPDVESIIQRMLRKQSGERYQSMEDVLQDLEPVWNGMRSNAAAVLAERAREFYELGDLPKAQDTLHRARQIDSSNAQAKSLFEKITAQLRRTEIQPRVQKHLSRGRVFLQAGQFREAQAEVEAALGLDSRYEPAQKLGEEVEAGAARAQQMEQKLRLTKQRLAEGALPEAETALRQALEVDANHPQALELKRQIGEEQSRREKRKQLNEVVHRARGLWTELKYDECLALLSEGLKTFPNEPELKNLQETARADQSEQKKQGYVSEVRRLMGQRKLAEARKALEILTKEQPADTSVKNLLHLLAQEEQEEKRKKRLEAELGNLRSLVGAGKLKEAVAKGEVLLKEFPAEHEVNELVVYARGEVAQQEQRKNEQEREKQIRGLMELQRYREAGEVARRAQQDFPKEEAFKSLAAEAEEKSKEQQEHERIQREVQQRIQEIRSKIKRQELTDAIDLAKQTLATLGPDTDVTQLLHAAEVESDERNKKREEGNQQIKAARALVEREDFAGARQLLDRAIANRIIPDSDMQVRMLLSQISEKEELLRREEQRRNKEDEPAGKNKSKEDENKSAEAKIPPRPPMLPGNVPSVARTTLGQSATSIAGAAAPSGQKPSVPVLTPLPAMAPQTAAIRAQVRIEGRTPKTLNKPASGGTSRKLAAAAVLVVVAAGGIYAAVRFVRRAPAKPSAEDVALEAEAKQLWDNHKADDSLADWKKLASHPGLLHDEAAQQVSDIEQKHLAVEQLYAQGMKLLYEEKKYPEAAEKFNEVLQMNLWKMDETRREYDIASKVAAGAAATTTPAVTPAVTPAKPAWQVLYENGQRAFARKDYSAARQYMEQARGADGVSKEISDKAQRSLLVIADREAQKKSLAQAMALEQSGQKQQAKDNFEQVAAAPNGDPLLVATAKTHIEQIGAIPQPPPVANANPNPPKNPPDYGAVLGEVRGLISQARWDDADAKLNGVPSTLPEYTGLKQQINNGRREDVEFSRVKTTFLQAEAAKNRTALRNLRPYFMAEANKGGSHGGDARNIVGQIDADLRESGSVGLNGGVSGGEGPHLGDLGGIKATLDFFAGAMENGDTYAVKAVAKLNEKDQERLFGQLIASRGKGYTLQNCSVPDINGQTAKVSCDAVLTRMSKSKHQRVKFQLSLLNGRWMIVSVH
jgi:eukaryotic-like serine/threonine-protein kinase